MVTEILAFVLAVSGIVVVYAFTKAKKPVITALKSAVCGISAMMLVNLTSATTGCYIAINYFTVFIATVLSLPGVIGLLLLNLVFI
ncbi:MAG: hypothetical protein E7488_06615 [Ruminococcaceae bacterium]|nr:hypothetical protein [Oscillospiraceae bacterium]